MVKMNDQKNLEAFKVCAELFYDKPWEALDANEIYEMSLSTNVDVIRALRTIRYEAKLKKEQLNFFSRIFGGKEL